MTQQPPPPGNTNGANNSASTEQAVPSVPRPAVEASYDVITKGSSDNESDNTEPGLLHECFIRVFYAFKIINSGTVCTHVSSCIPA